MVLPSNDQLPRLLILLTRREKERGWGGEKDAFRQETFIKYRSKEETEEDALAFSQSRAGSHQRLRTASKVQDAFLRQAIPPVRREG